MKTIRLGLVTVFCLSSVFAWAEDDNPLRRFFPYGVYVGGNHPEGLPCETTEELRASIDRVCKDLADHHMNCAWPNNLRWENLPLWLEAGRKHGIRIIPQGGGPPSFVRAKSFKGKEDLVAKVKPFYEKMAREYGNDPALLAWCLTEENRPEQWFYEAIAEVTDQMAEWDPNHPMITMDYMASTAWMNAQVVKPKAFARDVYVFFGDGLSGPYGPTGSRSLLTRECRRFREAADSCDAVYWIMGQGMELINLSTGFPHMQWRYPTEEEMRWQVWTSIQEGSKGFFYFIYAHTRGEPTDETIQIMEGLRDRNGEETPQYRVAGEMGKVLQRYAPVLLELEVAPPHKETVYWENTAVSGRTFIHRKTGQRFLIVVNHDLTSIQPVGIELGYYPQLLHEEEKVIDLATRRQRDYQEFKLMTLLPGDGTICFVGMEEEWERFAEGFYKN